MARPRKASTPKPTSNNSLLDAITFINSITKEEGTPAEVHSLIYNKQITAHNGIIGAGHSIEEDIFAAPNNYLMLKALSKCGEHFSITTLDGFRLSVKSNKFKAIVPCMDPNLIWSIAHTPDEPLYEINDNFKTALEAVGVLASENEDNIVAASILMFDQTLIASNQKAIFEYWHGILLPQGLALPKAIVGPLVKCGKKLSKFGCSQSSVTFWFEDNSWLKTQIHAQQWPNISHIFEHKNNPFPVPDDFWNGLAAVAPFSPNGTVHFDAGTLRSHGETGVGASFEVAGLPKGPVFSVRLLELIKPHAEKIDFLVDGGRMLYFTSKNIRGVVAGMGKTE